MLCWKLVKNRCCRTDSLILTRLRANSSSNRERRGRLRVKGMKFESPVEVMMT
jgi:hypothetical protein